MYVKNVANHKRARELAALLAKAGVDMDVVIEWRATTRQHLAVVIRTQAGHTAVVSGFACTPGDKVRGDKNFVSKIKRILRDE